jgi:hypothetical protein
MKKKITKLLHHRLSRAAGVLLTSTCLLGIPEAAHAQFPAPYCDFTLSEDWEPITLVNFAGINQTSPNTVVADANTANQALTNYTAVVGQLAQGFTYPTAMKGNTNGSYTNYFTVFIDWNQNGSFADAGELFQVGSVNGSTGLDAVQATSSITVPLTATLGNTRMRVVKKFSSATTSACASTWGAAQDFTITVIAAPCTAPTVTYTTVPNCAANQFSTNVNITNMGSASSIAIKEGVTTLATATATGSYVVGPFASNSSHTFVLENDVNALCNLTSPPQTFACPPANDNASGAIALTVNPATTCTATTTGTTNGATQSTEAAPTCSATGINDDVWYSFTAGGTNQTIAFSSVSAGTMAAALYSGTPANLSFITGACASTTLNASGLTPGAVYYLRAYTTTATTTTADFTVCVSTPASMSYVSSTVVQSSSSSLVAGSTEQQIIRTTVVAIGQNNPLNVTQLDYNTTGSTNAADIISARVYYTTSTTFSNATQFGTAVANPNGTFTVTGSQALAGGTSNTSNYFWLVYDIACAAAPANVVDAQCTSVTVGTPQIPTATNPSGTRAVTTLYATTRTDGNGTTAVNAGAVNAQFAYATVTGSAICAGTATTVNFTVAGTAPAADISQAKCYYTTSSTFSNAVPFGSAIANPAAGTITFNGSQALATGSNYFWLVYDISCTATASNTLNGDVASVVVSGTTVAATGTAASANAVTALLSTTQPNTTAVAAGTLNNQVVRVNVNPCGATSAITSATFNITGTTSPADILNAKVYYTTSTTFATTTQFGSTVANPNGSFTVTGNQAISAIGYLWLAYDLNCAATAANIIDGECTSVTLSGTPFAITASNPTGTKAITAATYSAAVTQASTSVAPQGSTGQQIIYATLNGCANTPVTSITFGTTGSTNTADITAARVYYTTSSTFSNAVQFGATIANPGASLTFTGNQSLTTGTGYFWLVYDIAAAATVTNVVDGTCTSTIINGLTTVPAPTTATGTRTIVAPLVNDNAPGALTIALGAGCTAATLTNLNASQDGSEPHANCSGTASYGTVWYKFVAPASGAVRVSTDLGTGNTLTDSRIALFSATDVNNYATFNIISCDEDGGNSLNSGYMSVLYATGLTSGTTYYVQVGAFASTTTLGTFCLAVDELSSSMLATSNNCSGTYQSPIGSNGIYTGWTPLLDAGSKLIALVRNTAGVSVSSYSVAQNINTGALRQDVNGKKYLDRNFRIVNSTPGNYDVQFFMLTTEQAALQAADPSATLSGLNITRVTGETGCSNNATGAGTASLITQTGSGSAGGVSWITFSTPGFSNFFVNGGTIPLPVVLKNFTGKNAGLVNNLNWETAEEKNFSHFELERSADGMSFNSLAQVEANRNSTGSKYAYTDAAPFEGINIYRLKMVDHDGKSSLSEVVTLMVKGSKNLAVQIYPNPVKHELNITINGQTDGLAHIQVLDITGKVVRTLIMSGNTANVDMQNLAAGMYLVKYVDNSRSSVTKITKE